MKVISLFTGAGGMDLGLEAAGFENAVAVEQDARAVATLKANPDRWGKIFDESIHDFVDETLPLHRRATRLLVESGLKAQEATLLAGGPPCQPFSKSGWGMTGHAKRLEDPRAKTLDAYLDVLATAQPEVFLLENVPGLSYTKKNEGLAHIERRIMEINKKCGVNYSYCVEQLNAAAYGVPQLRERVFVVGFRDGRAFEFPNPTHAIPPPVDLSTGNTTLDPDWAVPEGLLPATTAWHAIGHLEVDEQDPELQPKGKWAPVLPTIPEGANYLWHTSRGGGLDALWGWRTRYWSMLLKIAKNRPSWTLTASPGPSTGPFHWNNRRFAACELAALQTLPSDYTITGNNRAALKQLGNAVPSALAETLGREIRVLLGDELTRAPASLLPLADESIPAPVPPQSTTLLPPEILGLVAQHDDHPGAGKGPLYKMSSEARP